MINQNDTFRSYVGKIKDIYDNWEKITAENTEMTLTPTRKGKMVLLPKGNTFQNTTTGKNLVWLKDYTNVIQGLTTTISEQVWNISGTATNSWFIIGSHNGALNVPKVESNEDYTITVISTFPEAHVVSLWFDDTNGSQVVAKNVTAGANKTTTASFTFTGNSEDVVRFRLAVSGFASGSSYNGSFKIQLEKGTPATSYEQFTNGASPNPEFPQDIEIVTGDNTITISNSDNTQSQVFPISLGNIEMCSIGDYDDYFQIENDKWYKHNAVRKIELAIANMNNGNSYPGWRDVGYIKEDYPGINGNLYAYASFYSNIVQHQNSGIAFNTQGSGSIIFLLKSVFNLSEDEWKSNYPNLIFKLYYTIPTEKQDETEITDTTLIEQLNNIYENAKSYQDETNITQINDNLPFIISASALKKGGM